MMTNYRSSHMNNRYHLFGWLASSTWVVFTDRARPPQFPSWSVTVAVKFTKFSRNCAQETQSERVKASDVHNEITLLWGVLVSPFVDVFCFQYIFEEAARRVVASPITTVNIDKNLFSWNVKRCPGWGRRNLQFCHMTVTLILDTWHSKATVFHCISCRHLHSLFTQRALTSSAWKKTD